MTLPFTVTNPMRIVDGTPPKRNPQNSRAVEIGTLVKHSRRARWVARELERSDSREVDCAEFLARFSEYWDDFDRPAERVEMEAHLARCSRCRGYARAFRDGVQLVRSLPTLEVPEDFRPRLDHRIYHLEDGAAIAMGTVGSGATTLAVVAMAALLAIVAWTPAFRGARPSAEEPPVVAEEMTSTQPIFTERATPSTFFGKLSPVPSIRFEDGFWGDTHQLLFEYSSISERRRLGQAVPVAIE